MKVKELIELLKKLDGDLVVLVSDNYQGEIDEIDEATLVEKDVFLISRINELNADVVTFYDYDDSFINGKNNMTSRKQKALIL